MTTLPLSPMSYEISDSSSLSVLGIISYPRSRRDHGHVPIARVRYGSPNMLSGQRPLVIEPMTVHALQSEM